MIAVDTSALVAIVLGEVRANACTAALGDADRLVISAATVMEALIVAERRGVGEEMARLLDGLGFETIDLTESSARRAAQAYRMWGKGRHPAGLNYGDCFSYEVAKTFDCPLLYIGNDFARTDLASVL